MKIDANSLAEAKDLKVRLPLRYHVQLQSLKVLTGKNISTCVEEALAIYFLKEANRAKLVAPPAAPSVAPPAAPAPA